ncbi:MAG: cytochrome b [Pseudomonadota bacterium]
MRVLNSPERYGLVTKVLHWSTALLIFGLIALGWYMVDLTYFDKWYNESLSYHRAFGIVVLVLGIVTIAWRLFSASPHHQASLSRFEAIAATAMHHTLFLLIFLIPISGYLISTSAGKSVDMFGWFALPAVAKIPDDVRDWAIELHYYCGYGVGALAAFHAAAALKHQFIDKDGTLGRMIWK